MSAARTSAADPVLRKHVIDLFGDIFDREMKPEEAQPFFRLATLLSRPLKGSLATQNSAKNSSAAPTSGGFFPVLTRGSAENTNPPSKPRETEVVMPSDMQNLCTLLHEAGWQSHDMTQGFAKDTVRFPHPHYNENKETKWVKPAELTILDRSTGEIAVRCNLQEVAKGWEHSRYREVYDDTARHLKEGMQKLEGDAHNALTADTAGH